MPPAPTDTAALPSFRRVHLEGHPPGVTVLVLPFLGTGWVRRRLRYWWGRLMYLALFAGVLAALLAGWSGAMGDDLHGGRLNGQGWRILVAGALFGAEGLRVVLFKQGVPLYHLAKHPRGLVRHPYRLLLVAYLFFLALSPGLVLALTIDGLRPTLSYERTARADLDAQLGAR